MCVNLLKCDDLHNLGGNKYPHGRLEFQLVYGYVFKIKEEINLYRSHLFILFIFTHLEEVYIIFDLATKAVLLEI